MLIDGFMFYNEFDVLELRLELLDRYVDRFILVEAELNHKGDPKELFFQNNKERYAKWLHKITHIVVTAEESPKDRNCWSREKYQRDCVLRGLTDVDPSAIIMISDVDEIPDLTKVPFEKLPHLICSVHMFMFEYSLDYMFTGEPWYGTVITNVETFKKFGPNHFRDNRWKFPAFQFSGWHLSSFGDGKHVWNKLTTYAHALDATHIVHPMDRYDDFIREGLRGDGKTKLLRRPAEVPLPGSVDTLLRLKLLKRACNAP